MGTLYRPWGQLQWLLEQYGTTKWDLFGSLSTEDRCLAVRNTLYNRHSLNNTYLAQIRDADSLYSIVISQLIRNRTQDLLQLGGSIHDIGQHELFESPETVIAAALKFSKSSIGNVIIDISALPKRFFFLAIKTFLNTQVTNIIATYTIPAQYRSDEIAEDFQPWRPLPTFAAQSHDIPIQEFFVSVGHITMGLPEELESMSRNTKVKIFLPFPGHSQSIKRNWQFVQTIQEALPEGMKPILKVVHARDVSESFDHIVADTDHGVREALLAPFGPKPISLAMCLYACKNTNSRVYYTQPRIYPPDYSVGIEMKEGIPNIYGYCIRINGIDLYTV